MQLKLANFVHNGLFKPVADLCGFYRVKKTISGKYVTSKMTYGSEDAIQRQILSQFSSVRDFKDNAEFREFVNRKTAEVQKQLQREVREYVYPRLDFGALSAAYDENMKNYIKWLADRRPHLVDDALLARLGKLDRDDQIRAYEQDAKRNKEMYFKLRKEGLLDFINTKKSFFEGGNSAGGGMDGFDMPPDLGMEGPPMGGPSDADLGIPPEPIGESGPPENATGQNPPPGLASLEKSVRKKVARDDRIILDENKKFISEDAELKRVIGDSIWMKNAE